MKGPKKTLNSVLAWFFSCKIVNCCEDPCDILDLLVNLDIIELSVCLSPRY